MRYFCIMLELIRDIFQSPAGSFGFVFGLLALGYWLVHYVTKKVTEINASHSTLKCEMSDNKNDAHGKFSLMDGKIDEIRKDIAYLRGFSESIQKLVTDGYTQRHSPVSLTEKGSAEVRDSGLDKIVDRNWEKIFHTLENDVKSKNPYDIQSYCMENVYVCPDRFFNDDDVYYIKELAFKKGLALMTYTNMLAVLIRDRYFREKGLEISDIDRFDPHRVVK